MTTTTNHARSFSPSAGLPAPRALVGGLVHHPVWHALNATLVPVIAGGLALLTGWAVVAATGIAANSLPALFLVAGGILWMALALEGGRPLLIGAAAMNLAAMTAGAYSQTLNGTGMEAMYGLHLLILGAALLDRHAVTSIPTRLFAGAEMAALALMILHL